MSAKAEPGWPSPSGVWSSPRAPFPVSAATTGVCLEGIFPGSWQFVQRIKEADAEKGFCSEESKNAC